MKYLETSAKDGLNIEESFVNLVKEMKKKNFNSILNNTKKPPTLIRDTTKNKRMTCCWVILIIILLYYSVLIECGMSGVSAENGGIELCNTIYVNYWIRKMK